MKIFFVIKINSLLLISQLHHTKCAAYEKMFISRFETLLEMFQNVSSTLMV